MAATGQVEARNLNPAAWGSSDQLRRLRTGRPGERWPAAGPRRAEGEATADERELVRRAQRRDPAAFTELVRRHQDSLYRLAVRMVGPDAADDVAQQAFLKAWVGLASFQAQSAFGTWLYRIALNLCFDHLRRTDRFRPLPLDDVEASLSSGDDVAATVEAATEQAARQAALTRAVEQLPSEDRLLLHLRVGEQRSYDAIAELLGINPRTVGTRLFRARARLHRLVRQRLKDHEHGVP